MSKRRLGVTTVALLLLSACAQFTLVTADKRVKVGDAFSVEPQVAWTRIANPMVTTKVETWTIDGPLLHKLMFIKGADDGTPLYEPRDNAGQPLKNLPKFRKDMTPIEIAELFETTLTRDGVEQMDITKMGPAKFGDINGFRFDFTYLNTDGLRNRGFGIGGIHEDKLYMIIYGASNLHYYGKHIDTVERLVQSLQMI